jgi:hypothetical protein
MYHICGVRELGMVDEAGRNGEIGQRRSRSDKVLESHRCLNLLVRTAESIMVKLMAVDSDFIQLRHWMYTDLTSDCDNRHHGHSNYFAIYLDLQKSIALPI